MTKLEALQKAVEKELESRNLKNPKVRINALGHVCDYIKMNSSVYIKEDGNLQFPEDKDRFKKSYELTKKNKKLNDAESSVINEMYEQMLKI